MTIVTEDSGLHDESTRIAAKVISSLYETSTDREAVIVTASFLEFSLQTCLENFLVDNEAVRSRIFDPFQNGALSNFAPMVDMAYLLGLIPEQFAHWLKVMASVRNVFAHNWFVSSFADADNLDDKNVQKTLRRLRDFVPSQLRAEIHPLRQGYEILITTLLFGLYPLIRDRAIQHLPENKLTFQVAEGEKEWEAIARDFFSQHPEIMKQIVDAIQKSNDITESPDKE